MDEEMLRKIRMSQECSNYPWIDEYLMEKKGVTRNFEQWNWNRYLVGNKMFASVCLGEEDKPYYITLKCDPMQSECLRAKYADIVPGYYCNHVLWISINPNGTVPEDLVRDLLDQAYELVFQGLTKKLQREILA